MDALQQIQSDMAFMGWKGDPATGFTHKEDANGNLIAKHHDATWVADVEEATARFERLQIIRELERRETEGPTQ